MVQGLLDRFIEQTDLKNLISAHVEQLDSISGVSTIDIRQTFEGYIAEIETNTHPTLESIASIQTNVKTQWNQLILHLNYETFDDHLERCNATLEKYNSKIVYNCPDPSDSRATLLIDRQLERQNYETLHIYAQYEALKTRYNGTDTRVHIKTIKKWIKQIELIQNTVKIQWNQFILHLNYETFDDRLKKCEATLANYNSTLKKHCPDSSDSKATLLIERQLNKQNVTTQRIKAMYEKLKKDYEDPATDYSSTDIQGHINNIQACIQRIELIQQTVDRDWKLYHYKTFDDRLKKCEATLANYNSTLEKHCPYSSDSEATALIQRTLDEQNDIKLKTKVIYDDLKKGYEDPGTDYSRTDIQGHINNIQPYIKEIELIQQTVDRDWKRYHYKTFDDRLKKMRSNPGEL